MDDESAVSLETPLPLFPAAGMSVASMSAAEHASWMERAPHKRLMLFSGRSNPALGEDIAARIGIELGDVLLKTFTNGEVYVRYQESIRGADMFIVQSCSSPTNDSLMELLIMAQAARLASARRITAVMPWYPYGRQDKKSMPREPITAKLVADMLAASGVDRVLTMDLHAGQLQGFFDGAVDHMTAAPMLAGYFNDLLDVDREDVVVVSADAGRVKLAKKFSEMLGGQLALITKERPGHQEAEVTNVIGRVRGKVCILLDDMIDTAGTLCAGGVSLMAEGARRSNGWRRACSRRSSSRTPSRSTRSTARTRCRCCRWRQFWLIPSATSSTTIPCRGCSTAGISCSDPDRRPVVR
jgi:ribose-phosphate pyrophosphokinase